MAKEPASSAKSGPAHSRPNGSQYEGDGTLGNWRGESSVRRLDMPLFDGTKPDRWIFRVERYFGVNKMTEEEKMDAAVVCLDGEALVWFKWEEKRMADSKLGRDEGEATALISSLAKRDVVCPIFGSSANHHRKGLSSLQWFDMLAGPLNILSEGSFMNGFEARVKGRSPVT